MPNEKTPMLKTVISMTEQDFSRYRKQRDQEEADLQELMEEARQDARLKVSS
ncbi:MAG: hypothetical protein SFT92_01915 [Rickettsiales bacterium]|nr:hypothetical protein [Rickettsiales bacterium]